MFDKHLPNLNDLNAHLGFLTEGPGSMRLHNQILLSYKQFFYEHRKIKHSINITEFWNYVKTIYKIELEIAKKNDKLTSHNSKWQNLFRKWHYRRLSISLTIYMTHN